MSLDYGHLPEFGYRDNSADEEGSENEGLQGDEDSDYKDEKEDNEGEQGDEEGEGPQQESNSNQLKRNARKLSYFDNKRKKKMKLETNLMRVGFQVQHSRPFETS
ncbi:hypothetical protein DAPPUDRAFT_253906 [Daphnia pulex]|uniref:Uncharacterized protein n=1 Tax=Daphnia pulex TaxID=6669 RepID=E9H5X2_DAPPU|nr:hypothetical protein DAPPUDRAFT_253906 [Daphnia pulex]|eukprot:EFX72862.1 hypothetical protein DAPPUDRAFT_253906 [Daphnia pulex]